MSSVITREVIKKEFIQEIKLAKEELSRHLKNTETNFKKSIQNQCHREIIERNRKNVEQMKEKVNNYNLQLSQIENNNSEMVQEIENRYRVRLEKHKRKIEFQRKMEKRDKKE